MKKRIAVLLLSALLILSSVWGLPAFAAPSGAQQMQMLQDYYEILMSAIEKEDEYDITMYFYYDLNNDGFDELFVSSWEYLDLKISVYGMISGKVAFLGEFWIGGPTSFYASSSGNGLLEHTSGNGLDSDELYRLTISNGRLKQTLLESYPIRTKLPESSRVRIYEDEVFRFPTLTDLQKKYVLQLTLEQQTSTYVPFTVFMDIDRNGVMEMLTTETHLDRRVELRFYSLQDDAVVLIGKKYIDINYDYQTYYIWKSTGGKFFLSVTTADGHGTPYYDTNYAITLSGGNVNVTQPSYRYDVDDIDRVFGLFYNAQEYHFYTPDMDVLFPGGLITVTEQPQSVSAMEGEPVSFSVKAQGNGLKYRWQYKKEDDSAWGNCGEGYQGVDSNTLQLTALSRRDGIRYRCKITNAAGSSTFSEVVLLSVERVPLAITQQPEDIYVTENSVATFHLEAQGSGLQYRWQYLNDSGEWKYTGVNAQTLEVETTAGHNGAQYRCEVTDSAGEKVYSEPAALTVDVVKITVQPKSVKADEGAAAKFSLKADGWYLSYQWQFKNENGTWTNCGAGYTGADTNEMTVTATAKRDGMTYRCLVTNNTGARRISKEVTLTLNPFGFTQQPKSVTAELNADVTFSVQAEGENLSYRWQYLRTDGKWADNSGVSGYDTKTLALKATKARDGIQYRCVITNAAGTKKISDPATLTIKEAKPAFIPGDVDANGTVDAADARLALRRAVGLEDYKEGSVPFLACDVTKDGVISAEDARLILRAAVGLETLT